MMAWTRYPLYQPRFPARESVAAKPTKLMPEPLSSKLSEFGVNDSTSQENCWDLPTVLGAYEFRGFPDTNGRNGAFLAARGGL